MNGSVPVTVVTPTLNAARFIHEAIESLGAQKRVEYEHIVVDGGSTDGTIETVRQLDPQARVVVAEGAGIYAALNIGINEANFDHVFFLNADDGLSDVMSLWALAGTARRELQAVVCGGASFHPQSLRSRPTVEFFELDAIRLDWTTVLLGPPLINAKLFPRAVLRSVGGFDSTYRIAGDRELLSRLARIKVQTTWVTRPVYRYRMHEGSLTLGGSPPRGAFENLRLSRAVIHNDGWPEVAKIQAKRRHAMVASYVLRNRGMFPDSETYLREATAAFRTDPIWPIRHTSNAAKDRLRALRDERGGSVNS